MKLRMSCVKCIQEKTYNNEQDMIIEFRDDGIYNITCHLGHNSVIFLEQQKFEVLIDMGVMALIDGYTRESVSSFSAALERFYEFCILVFLRKRKTDFNQFEKTWKNLRNQSERQIGAFFLLYLSEFNKAPEVFKDSDIKFRNDVIHKGKFPSYKESLDYAEKVFNYIKTILVELKENYDEEIQYIIDKDVIHYIEDNCIVDDSVLSWSIDTIIRTIRPIEEIRNKDLKLEIERRREYKIFER